MSFEHLLEHEGKDGAEQSSLEEIANYSKEILLLRKEAAELENQLALKKKHLQKYEQELLPRAMLSIGMTKFSLSSGQEVKIEEELSCSVKDYSALYDFLEERGDDALIKTSIEIGKLPQNILNRVLRDLKERFDLEGTSRLYIHPSTLKAYFKRLCAIGTDKEAEVAIGSISQEMVSTYTYYKVKIK